MLIIYSNLLSFYIEVLKISIIEDTGAMACLSSNFYSLLLDYSEYHHIPRHRFPRDI